MAKSSKYIHSIIRKIVLEELNNLHESNLESYHDSLLDQMKPYNMRSHNKIHGFEFEYEPMTGSWGWYNKDTDVYVYLTPYTFALGEKISIHVSTADNNEYYLNEIPFKKTTNIRKYIKVVKTALQAVNKKLK